VKSKLETKFIDKLDLEEIENLRELLYQTMNAKNQKNFLNKNPNEP